ncbi:ANTAR domain-containing protein [Streptomyces sp. G-G2]|uniref:ANTAR domain-containing protein n=1 Tax=Streptomyces sp. G-G2 TaxID=3046201 RepID=UPI0024B9B26D|nr:ANTAR domain-containing protein [Streptomyces sp. G-G2]MDJ0386203.1 ANTAR domain-containing protein [Streptomyces sp. G-G2]
MFAHQAVELGVRAVFSLPLGTPATAVGTLDLHRARPGPLSQQDQLLAFPIADAITTALLALHERDAGEDGGPSWLDDAESDRGEVHQATGMVMVHLGVGPQQAPARLRARAFVQGQSVSDRAREVLAGRLGLHDGTSTPGQGHRRAPPPS